MRRLTALLIATVLAAAACGGGSDDGASGPAEEGPFADGRTVYRASCSACHGSAGQGGTGPGMTSIVDHFPECADLVEWISLGSSQWQDTYGDTYGADATPVSGGMPGFGGSRTEAELQAVSTYVRAQFGGESRAEAA